MKFKPEVYNREKTLAHMQKHGLDVNYLGDWIVKFKSLRSNAKHRHNVCRLTLSQYVKLAIKADIVYPSQIGNKSDQFQMARIGDQGRYEWGNCRFVTTAKNNAERCENGGAESQAKKLRGRTKENHEGVRSQARKLRGRTKDTHPGYRSISEKKTGRTKLNDSSVRAMADKKRGRTKEAYPGLRSQAEKVSKSYVVRSPSGKIYRGRNLSDFARSKGLNPDLLASVCRGVNSHHKKWTGCYVL